jgi:formimidoylglutamate deiminase
MSVPNRYRFASARLPDGWKRDVVITIRNGLIAEITAGDSTSEAHAIAGAAIPGMPNVHSHAFQRAMAGLAEARSTLAGSTQADSFWTWRETMYAVAQRITPESLNAIAAQLYVEMLKAGYTRVCEFHYLHNQPDGSRYAERAVMSQAMLDAGATAGIGMTLLPTLYQTSDFGGAPPTARQRQFVLTNDEFVELLDSLKDAAGDAVIGMALHSLRAVPPAALAEVIGASAVRNSPVHIHIAEQQREVQECVRALQCRPVEWLLEHAPVDERWCLVHVTHASSEELRSVAQTGAVIGLCPTTEANLGDGLFDVPAYFALDGRVGIGSDSHISINAAEELRWLEYQSRLSRRERNVLATTEQSTGARWGNAVSIAGSQAAGIDAGAIEQGHRADIVVLDTQSPTLVGRTEDALLDTFVFSGQANPIREVMVNGRWVVQDGLHFAEIPIAASYRRAMRTLFA